MTGVEANSDARVVVERAEHLRDLLEASPHAAAETRVVLDEQARRLGIRALEHMSQVLGDLRQTRLEATALVRTGVKDHAVDPELVSGLQVAGKRALRALAHRRVVAGEVDQIDRVKIEGRMTELCGRLLESRDAVL